MTSLEYDPSRKAGVTQTFKAMTDTTEESLSCLLNF